jgi:cytoskeleton protein RodZ
MITFENDPELSPGRCLYNARAELGLSLEACASRTRIPVRSLRAIEHDNWAALPAPVYVKGFLKAYAAELGLDVEPILDAWESHGGERPVTYKLATELAVSIRTDQRTLPKTGLVAGLALGAAVVVIWAFAGQTTSEIVAGPDTGVESPQSGPRPGLRD